MQFYKTIDNDGYVRIEEDSGAAITLYLHRDIARILALLVPGTDRRAGIGTALLMAAEKEAYARGIRTVEADFSDGILGMQQLFEGAGYDVNENAPVFAMDTKKLLASEKVIKLLKRKVHARFEALEELMMMQWEELSEILKKFSIPLSSRDLGRFSQNMSGIVRGRDGRARAVILCSEMEGRIHIDLLGASKKENHTYAVTALQGMLLEVLSSGGARQYPVLTALCAHDNIRKIMESVLPDRPQQIGMAIYAKKELSAEPVNEMEIDEDLDGDMLDEWRREIAGVPLQSNIGWKAAWYRERRREKEAENPKHQEPEADGKEEDKNFPDELFDPLDIDYKFDKDEDETEGLVSDDARRITIDNLDDFRGILPADVLQDLPRPWHRGLAVGTGQSGSYLVYELTKGSSEIKWLDLSGNGNRLFLEYSNEVKAQGTVKSFIETDKGKDKRAVLSDAGFMIEERESETLIITVAELMKLPFVSRKVPEYVLGLSDIGERQFKRGIGQCILNNRKGLLEDLAYIPMEWFEQDVSSVVFTDQRVSGMLLVHQLPSRRLTVDLLFSSSGDARLDILRMIIHSARAAADKYPKDTPVILRRHNKMVRAITDRFFPGKKGAEVLYGERKEA